MTTQLKYVCFALVLAMSSTGCYFGGDDDGGGIFSCARGSGAIVTRTFDLSTFTGFEIKSDIDVYLRQGDAQSVEVEGKENLLDLLELDIQGKIWDIEFDRCVRDIGEFKVYITLPDINFIGVSGSGKVYSENQLESPEIELKISGSGDIDAAILVEKLDAKISGSGKIKLEGATNDFYLKISGSGDYDGFDLDSQTGTVKINASGDVEVYVMEELDVKINGSGDLSYKGFPLLNISINGSGDVVNAN